MPKFDLKIDLNDRDVNFLSKLTKLSVDKVKKLTEEKADIDLIIDSVCNKKHTKKDMKLLSIGFYIRYLVFKHSKKYNFNLSEKTYMADAFLTQLPLILEKIDLSLEKLNESRSQNIIIMLGLFYYFFEQIPDFSIKKYIYRIEAALRGANQRDLAGHITNWIDIFKDISDNDELLFGAFRDALKVRCNNNLVGVEGSAHTPVGV